MLTLFYSPGACSLAPHILLEMSGQPYKLVKADRSSPEFLQLNPAGAVPAMILNDGSTLTQCGAIIGYLQEVYPQLAVSHPTSPEKRAQISRWSSFMTGDLHPAFYPSYFPARYITNGTDDEFSRVKQASQKLIQNKLTILNNELGSNQYLANNEFSVADIYSFPMMRWAKNMLPNGLADYPNLADLYNRIAALPAVQAALQQEGITA